MPGTAFLNIKEYIKGLHFRLLSRQISRNRYANTSPCPQNALNIFYGDWISCFPESLGSVEAGETPLYSDERIKWFIDEIGGISNRSVLELGPMEGLHSFLLETSGAKSITSIESDTKAYLKCLVTKEILQLKRVRFLCGDFIEYLRDSKTPVFDTCAACGVLYHMVDPAELISLISEHCRQYLFIWTHYFDAEIIESDRQLARRFRKHARQEYRGFEYTAHPRHYLESTSSPTFCGASSKYASWMTKSDLIRCLDFFGFDIHSAWFDVPDHENGPSIALIASRK